MTSNHFDCIVGKTQVSLFWLSFKCEIMLHISANNSMSIVGKFY